MRGELLFQEKIARQELEINILRKDKHSYRELLVKKILHLMGSKRDLKKCFLLHTTGYLRYRNQGEGL